MQDIAAIVWDVDGTLSDTEEVHRRAFNAAFQELGVEWYWTRRQYALLLSISGGEDRIRYFARSRSGPSSRLAEDAEFVRTLHTTKSEMYRCALQELHIGLRPGVLRLLLEAKAAGIPLALATCTSLKNVRQLLDLNLPTDWPAWFDVIVTSKDVQEMKPSPLVYQHTLKALGVDAQASIAIEDTPNGYRAASTAGMHTVITTNLYTRHCSFPSADLVVTHLGESTIKPEVIAGEPLPDGYVNLPALRALLRSAKQPRVPGGTAITSAPRNAGPITGRFARLTSATEGNTLPR